MTEFTSPIINKPVDGSLLAWYKGSGSRRIGTVLADLSGNKNNGTITSGAWKNTPLGHNVLNFDGANTKVDLGSDIIGVTDITLCAWIYPAGWGGNNTGRIFGITKCFLFVTTTNDRLNFTSDGGGSTIASAVDSIVLNKWQFVVVTRTTTGATNFYINSVQSGVANSDSGTPVAGGNTLIGNHATLARAFDGKIDDMRIYNKIFTANEVMKLYQETRHFYGR